jgi:hypothetical protein
MFIVTQIPSSIFKENPVKKIMNFAFCTLISAGACVAFGQGLADGFQIQCQMNDSAQTTLMYRGNSSLQYELKMFKTIGGKSYYIDLHDADEIYPLYIEEAYLGQPNLGFGTIVGTGGIPVLSGRPWNELTRKNTFDYYVIERTTDVEKTALYFSQNGRLEKTYFGQPEFLELSAPFLSTIQSYTWDSPKELVTVARPHSLVVHLSEASKFTQGSGFVMSEVVATSEYLLRRESFRLPTLAGPFQCALVK